jgi:hypothetical protein
VKRKRAATVARRHRPCRACYRAGPVWRRQSLSDLDLAPSANKATNDAPCPRERLAFLQRVWPTVEGALARIEDAPLARVATQTRSVPVERAQRVGTPALLRAVRNGAWPPPGANVAAPSRRQKSDGSTRPWRGQTRYAAQPGDPGVPDPLGAGPSNNRGHCRGRR